MDRAHNPELERTMVDGEEGGALTFIQLWHTQGRPGAPANQNAHYAHRVILPQSFGSEELRQCRLHVLSE